MAADTAGHTCLGAVRIGPVWRHETGGKKALEGASSGTVLAVCFGSGKRTEWPVSGRISNRGSATGEAFLPRKWPCSGAGFVHWGGSFSGTFLAGEVGFSAPRSVREATQSPCRILCRLACRIRYRIVCREGDKSGGSRPLLSGRGRPVKRASGRASWGVREGLSEARDCDTRRGYPSVRSGPGLAVRALEEGPFPCKEMAIPRSSSRPPSESVRPCHSGQFYPRGRWGEAS